MSWIECGSCEEMIDVCGGAVRLPYICGRCENAALAIEEDAPCDVPYNSGVPCQSALDSVQADVYTIQDALDQFHADTELIDGLMAEIEDLKAQLEYREAAIEILKNALVNIFNDAAVAMSR
jgi:hypothetical protein